MAFDHFPVMSAEACLFTGTDRFGSPLISY